MYCYGMFLSGVATVVLSYLSKSTVQMNTEAGKHVLQHRSTFV